MEISSLCVIFFPPSELENNRTSFLSEGHWLNRRNGVESCETACRMAETRRGGNYFSYFLSWTTAFSLSLKTLAKSTKRSWVEWNCVPDGWLIFFFLSEGEARRGVDYSSPSPFEGEGWGEGFAKINPSS